MLYIIARASPLSIQMFCLSKVDVFSFSSEELQNFFLVEESSVPAWIPFFLLTTLGPTIYNAKIIGYQAGRKPEVQLLGRLSNFQA